ncbi:MAG: competence/damage-inducible protein A [Sandaracinaceae bacterium]
MARTAAALIIGNEILTGKIRDENLFYLGRELFLLGIALRRVVLCPDELDVIADDLTHLRQTHDLVFTSGGVGPTHDDVTLDGVARSFGRRLVRSSRIESMIHDFWKDRVTAGHLRMADLPEGAELQSRPDFPWPVIRVDNVYVLPGVPALFRVTFHTLRDQLGADAPFVSRALYTRCDEGEIADLLEKVMAAHPEVAIGSYPTWRDPEVKVKLTFDGRDEGQVIAALEDCQGRLPSGVVVRRE